MANTTANNGAKNNPNGAGYKASGEFLPIDCLALKIVGRAAKKMAKAVNSAPILVVYILLCHGSEIWSVKFWIGPLP